LLAKLWGSKVAGVPTWAILGLKFFKKNHLDVGPWRGAEYTIRGKVVPSPKSRWCLLPSPGRGESCVSVLPEARPSTKGVPTMH